MAVPQSPASQGLRQIPAASQCDLCWEPSWRVNAEVVEVQVLAALCEAAKLFSRIELCAREGAREKVPREMKKVQTSHPHLFL